MARQFRCRSIGDVVRDLSAKATRAAIAGGRPCVRTALYMAALVASRHNPQMKAAYLSLREQGKPAKVALIAVARRLLVTANALVKANQSWGPDAKNT